MNRRTAIRNVLVISAGAIVLQSCQDKATITLKRIPITGPDEELVDELGETIIPKTANFIGARDLKTREFIFTMADDTLSPELVETFAKGMKSFDEECKSKMGSRFIKLSSEKRAEFLRMIEADQKATEFKKETIQFYGMVKYGTIENFTTSQQYLADVKGITTLIPPKFQACVPVTNS